MTNFISSDFLKRFGIRIQNLRNEKQLSALELAHKCALTEENITALESGQWDCPLDIALQVADALDMKVSEILQGL